MMDTWPTYVGKENNEYRCADGKTRIETARKIYIYIYIYIYIHIYVCVCVCVCVCRNKTTESGLD